jgi:hypothetical protein
MDDMRDALQVQKLCMSCLCKMTISPTVCVLASGENGAMMGVSDVLGSDLLCTCVAKARGYDCVMACDPTDVSFLVPVST